MSRRAVVLGGTGALGAAIARRLAAAGVDVVATGRDRSRVPEDFAPSGIAFVSSNRHDVDALRTLVGTTTDVLVDGLCYTAADARTLLGVAADAGSTVVLSSRAVYAQGLDPSRREPLDESAATVAPSEAPITDQPTYAGNKVAAERVLLDGGLPVSVLRVAKAHGRGAREPREWVFVRRVLDGRRVVVLADRGEGRAPTSAAVNVAELVATCATSPGARVLNAVDPDRPRGLDVERIVARHLGHRFEEVLVDGDPAPPVGDHPWNERGPALDDAAARALGYVPVGGYAATVLETIDGLVAAASARGVDGVLGPDAARGLARYLDYGAEDAFLSGRL